MKKIMFAVFAISAIALLNSCGNVTSGPVDFPNGVPATQMSQHSAGYNVGEREQTETGDITYTGTIDGQFLDADMVPVRLCDGQIVWAKFAGNLYKVAVEMNQIITKGGTVQVSMQEVNWHWFWRRFEIKSIVMSISAPLPLPTAIPVFKKPVLRRVQPRRSSGGSNCFPNNPGRYQPQPTVIVQQQPCCCGTNITINGTNNASIITGNGNNTGAIDVPNAVPVQPEPMWTPVVPQKDRLKEFNPIPNGKLNLDSSKTRNVVAKKEKKKESKKEPWTFPWS